MVNSQSDENLATLAKLLTFRAGGTYNKHAVPYLVCLGILRYGARGIRTLVAALQTAPGAIYPTAILAALFYAADGQLSPAKLTPCFTPHELTQQLHTETIREAKSAVADVVQESFLNSELFDRVISFFYQNQLLSAVDANAADRFRMRFFSLFTEASIKISRPLIERFKNLITAQRPEEEYQEFLEKHPVFLDPLAAEMIPKQRMGSEHITDFVLRRLDNEYRAVEIEKPQDAIFVKGKAVDFSAPFFHGIGQVVDFQSWLFKNIAYAKEIIPGIAAPVRGILLIGSRAGWSSRESEKFYTYVHGHNSIEVLTYDDLLDRAHNLYANLMKRHEP